MLNGGHNDAFCAQCCGQTRVNDVSEMSAYDRLMGQVGPDELDAMVDRSRVDRQVDLFARVKSDTAALNGPGQSLLMSLHIENPFPEKITLLIFLKNSNI
jgi:hypothetical protein